MNLRIFADATKLVKKFVKKDQDRIIYVSSSDLPISDYKPDIYRNYICDNTGYMYFTEQKVLSFHI